MRSWVGKTEAKEHGKRARSEQDRAMIDEGITEVEEDLLDALLVELRMLDDDGSGRLDLDDYLKEFEVRDGLAPTATDLGARETDHGRDPRVSDHHDLGAVADPDANQE